MKLFVNSNSSFGDNLTFISKSGDVDEIVEGMTEALKNFAAMWEQDFDRVEEQFRSALVPVDVELINAEDTSCHNCKHCDLSVLDHPCTICNGAVEPPTKWELSPNMTIDEFVTWCDCRETSLEVAAAIASEAKSKQEMNAIWEDPTEEQRTHIVSAAKRQTEEDLFWGGIKV